MAAVVGAAMAMAVLDAAVVLAADPAAEAAPAKMLGVVFFTTIFIFLGLSNGYRTHTLHHQT
jgi:hypothetical protein